MNDAGQTAFFASTWDGSGFWSEGSGSLALVARDGDLAPGTPGLTFAIGGSFSFLELNSAGQTSFQSPLTLPDGNDRGMWSEGRGSMALVARREDPAPGTPSGVTFNNFFVVPPVLNDVGQTAFFAYLTGPEVNDSNNAGIWSESSGTLRMVARTGSQAPGTPNGVTYSLLLKAPFLNNLGQTAFWGRLTGSGVDSTNTAGLWLEHSGSVGLLVRAGDRAPGTPSGVNFIEFFPYRLNNAGQIAFQASLTGSGVGSMNDTGIWAGPPGAFALVARSGSQAPGTSIGTLFFHFERATLNEAGHAAFPAILSGTGVDTSNDKGLWSDHSGTLTLIARDGDQAPGTPEGVNFREIDSRAALNSAGQIAFGALLIGTGVDENSDRGIWATDRTGALQLIVREGGLLEVSQGDFRSVREAYLAYDSLSGNSRGFNNLGQLAFQAYFVGGSSGVFVSNRVAVPEPAAFGPISSISRTAHRIEITMPVQAGQVVGVHYSVDLVSWDDLGDFSVTGEIGTFVDSNAAHLAASLGYFRAVLR